MFRHSLKKTTLLLMATMLISLLCAGETKVNQNTKISSKQPDTSKSVKNDESDSIVNNVISHQTGDLDKMLEKRLIRVLVIPSKIMYHVDKGKKSGVVYDMMREFEKSINMHYPPKLKHLKKHITFIPVSREELIPALIEGRGDIAVADLAITSKKKQKIDFSDPFYHNVNEIIITGPSSPEIKRIEDLSGKEIFAHPSSSYWEHLEKINIRFSKTGLSPIKLKRIPNEFEDEDLLEMVNAGLIGMVVVYEHKATLWSKVLPSIVLHTKIPIKTDLSFGWMIRKKSPLLKKEINTFIKAHKAGTLFGNILLNRYLNSERFVKYATSQKELVKFQKVVQLFKRYSDRYDLNYLLMVAQGYQESQLNQKKRSPVGAVGIMQLMPATGKEMNVGDIKKEEQNIHAGHKYLRWLMDRYFKNEPMDEFNRTLFAFAAYNAGPARIRGLRKVTKERGQGKREVWNLIPISPQHDQAVRSQYNNHNMQ
jgi:membrane-bound lytic murein transglycosylase MltF